MADDLAEENLFPFEPRKSFRPPLPDETLEQYNAARAEDKIELSLRRSHQLHTAIATVIVHQDLMRVSLFGDPRMPADTGGAFGAIHKQVTAIQEAQKSFPGQMREEIVKAAEKRDSEAYRSLIKWAKTSVGVMIVTIVIAIALVWLHLPSAAPIR